MSSIKVTNTILKALNSFFQEELEKLYNLIDNPSVDFEDYLKSAKTRLTKKFVSGKKEHGDKPLQKRAPNSYQIYLKENLSLLKNEFNLSQMDAMKMCANNWKNLEDKTKYKNLAEEKKLEMSKEEPKEKKVKEPKEKKVKEPKEKKVKEFVKPARKNNK